MQEETSPNLQDDTPKTTQSSVLSKLGLDFIDPQPEMGGINTKEAEASTKTDNHEAESQEAEKWGWYFSF
jgi:hypothetical protein